MLDCALAVGVGPSVRRPRTACASGPPARGRNTLDSRRAQSSQGRPPVRAGQGVLAAAHRRPRTPRGEPGQRGRSPATIQGGDGSGARRTRAGRRPGSNGRAAGRSAITTVCVKCLRWEVGLLPVVDRVRVSDPSLSRP